MKVNNIIAYFLITTLHGLYAEKIYRKRLHGKSNLNRSSLYNFFGGSSSFIRSLDDLSRTGCRVSDSDSSTEAEMDSSYERQKNRHDTTTTYFKQFLPLLSTTGKISPTTTKNRASHSCSVAVALPC